MTLLLLSVIYLAFIALGLPDSLLGAAWPSMFERLQVPVSYMGAISMTISFSTVMSSLFSYRLTRRFGPGLVTAVSTVVTALSLFGFSVTSSFWLLLFWAVPLGLGAGNVDAALNNYVAIHYESKHMSWLHGMWGLGTLISPNVLSWALTRGMNWSGGYRSVGFIQLAMSLILFLSLPLWKKSERSAGSHRPALTLRETLRVPGVIEQLIGPCFCYCAIEQTAMLWGSSYLVLHSGVSAETAAGFASMFLIGMTVGRFSNGFLTLKFSDEQLIRMGEVIIAIGALTMLIPMGYAIKLAGLILIGLGCAPICPCNMHATPKYFGSDQSQAVIGLHMAASYSGIMIMPPLFGLIANHVSIGLLPVYLLLMLAVLFIAFEKMLKKVL